MLQTLKSIALKVISFLILIGIAIIVILQFPLGGKQGEKVKSGGLFSFLQSSDPVDSAAQSSEPQTFLFADQTAEVLTEKGYTLFDGVYNADTCVLGMVDLSLYAYINNLPRVFINSTNNYPYLYPRMGYLYRYDTSGAKMLLDGTGKEIKTTLMEKMTFAGERDKLGKPLFTNNNQYFTYYK